MRVKIGANVDFADYPANLVTFAQQIGLQRPHRKLAFFLDRFQFGAKFAGK
jgi:hypothetical protein